MEVSKISNIFIIKKLKFLKTKGNNTNSFFFRKSLQSMDIVLVLDLTSNRVTLTITGVGDVVVRITIGVDAGLCIFSKTVGESLSQK